MSAAYNNALQDVTRLTLKIGSALLVDSQTGLVRTDWLKSLCADIASFKKNGTDIIIVSSGAIALGRAILGLKNTTKPLLLDQAQAAASVGQIALNQAWRDALAEHDIVAGQMLLTPNITEERRQFLNARATLSTLLAFGAVPIINENDSVTTAEIRYGDNDRLSARVAAMAGADMLVLFSDVDGLYTSPPSSDSESTHIPLIKQITPKIEAMAGGAASHLSRGGMSTKIDAAKIATGSGTAMIIANGKNLHPLQAIAEGGKHSLFVANQSQAAARKIWILGTLELAGEIHVDQGAATALKKGKSLLAIGVTKVKGAFNRGDTVSVLDPTGTEIARGLVGMSREEADLAKGKKSEAVAHMLGHSHRTELAHADNLVLMANETHEGSNQTND